MYLQIIVLALIWGVNWVFMKAGMAYFPPILFSALRFLSAGAVLLIISRWRGVTAPTGDEWGPILFTGLVQIAFTNAVLQNALLIIDAGLASVLFYTMPLWLSMLAHFLLPDDRLSPLKISALLLGVVGLTILLKLNPDTLLQLWQRPGTLSELLVLVASVAWALCNIVMKRVSGRINALRFTTYQMITGGLLLLAYSALTEPLQLPPALAYQGWATVAFSGIVASALAFLMWFRLLRAIPASTAGISLLLVPVVGVFSGVLLLGETVDLAMITGMALILISIGLVNVSGRRGRGAV